ncbi:PRC-barrel domain-containing protein [Clostridium felsineum]|uniref:Uncharacterized protein n=1 Tax=Clostridium felsineum TaxID=36839 RepID=A0A1S8MDL6_9CLOT|nr:PRC-barrel domain-containing protein [Clostridium felsineum]MCR3757888.1 PRC-barrel domain-containing protein [Clostridium felsineum]URZ06394.1 hypothetical protein CLROS_017270 [Clostridium felsineum]URZ11429.1 hypothetical protein CROST_021460 [Clostridium felsineum]
MIRSKKFINADVYSTEGKKIGIVDDIILNFNSGFVIGFKINKGKLFNKKCCISRENLVSFNSKMIVKFEEYKGTYIEFNNIRNMDVVNNDGTILGMVEEIIFDEKNFKIKGIIVSRGFFANLVSGKKVILEGNYMLGKENLFCFTEDKKLNFVRLFHSISMEDDEDEKNI